MTKAFEAWLLALERERNTSLHASLQMQLRLLKGSQNEEQLEREQDQGQGQATPTNPARSHSLELRLQDVALMRQRIKAKQSEPVAARNPDVYVNRVEEEASEDAESDASKPVPLTPQNPGAAASYATKAPQIDEVQLKQEQAQILKLSPYATFYCTYTK